MRVNSNYVLSNVLNSYILVNVKSNLNSVIKLNKTSKDVFDCVSKGMEHDEIVASLLNKYDVDEKVLIKDVDEYIEDMVNKGIFLED